MFKQSNAPSTPEQKDKVVGTSPPANQTRRSPTKSPSSSVRPREQGKSPTSRVRTVAQAQQKPHGHGFTKVTQVDVDSPRPAGTVLSTNPATGQSVPLDTIVECQALSRGNQFTMLTRPASSGTTRFPPSAGTGWTGSLHQGRRRAEQRSAQRGGGDAEPGGGQRGQSDAPITLVFAQ